MQKKLLCETKYKQEKVISDRSLKFPADQKLFHFYELFFLDVYILPQSLKGLL